MERSLAVLFVLRCADASTSVVRTSAPTEVFAGLRVLRRCCIGSPPSATEFSRGHELATTRASGKEHVDGNRVTHRILSVSHSMIHEEIRGSAKLVSDK
jgi:hypothetical protein